MTQHVKPKLNTKVRKRSTSLMAAIAGMAKSKRRPVFFRRGVASVACSRPRARSPRRSDRVGRTRRRPASPMAPRRIARVPDPPSAPSGRRRRARRSHRRRRSPGRPPWWRTARCTPAEPAVGYLHHGGLGSVVEHRALSFSSASLGLQLRQAVQRDLIARLVAGRCSRVASVAVAAVGSSRLGRNVSTALGWVNAWVRVARRNEAAGVGRIVSVG